jgi:hypothetical protein
MLQAVHRAAELKDTNKAAAATAKSNLIEELYAPKSKMSGLANPMAAILPRENFDAYWDASLARNKGDAQAAKAETEDHFKKFLSTAPVGADSFRRLLGK